MACFPRRAQPGDEQHIYGLQPSVRRTTKERRRPSVTEDQARRFFIDKLVAEADRSGVALSVNERKTLDWSEVEPGCIGDPAVAEALSHEISDESYETKISRLLKAAYDHDLAADAGAKAAYRDAYSVLKQGDYYLLIMIERALGRRLRRWWQFTMS